MPAQLGDLFLVHAQILRRTHQDHYQRRKTWDRAAYPFPLVAMLVGVRTLYNGTTDYMQDTGQVFYPEAHFRAYELRLNLNRNSVFAYPNDCHPDFFAMPEQRAFEWAAEHGIPIEMHDREYSVEGKARLYRVMLGYMAAHPWTEALTGAVAVDDPEMQEDW